MSNFIYNSYCVEHPGVVRIYQTEEERLCAVRETPCKPETRLVLVAAMLAAVGVALNQISQNWSDSHVLAAWVILWAMAFASVALFTAPARRLFNIVRIGYRAWVDSRQQAAADERVWNAALQDARLMADLARAMDRQRR